MAIDIYLVDKNHVFWNYTSKVSLYESLGTIDEEYISFARNLPDDFIGFIRYIGPLDNVVFNYLQVTQLAKELSYLHSASMIPLGAYIPLKHAIEKVQYKDNYLKFDID